MKPILFNTEMVWAILKGCKTVTRRLVKPQPWCDSPKDCGCTLWDHGKVDAACPIHCVSVPDVPYHPGDILWVRETWCRWYLPHGEWQYRYKATDPNGNMTPTGPEYDDEWEVRPWRPSIHMPKEAARLFLRVTEVRVERLQDITTEQALSEGAWTTENACPFSVRQAEHPNAKSKAISAFAHLWDGTIKPADLPLYGWETNPWVWVIEFERISKEAAIGGGGDG